jgi:hypothetical protein
MSVPQLLPNKRSLFDPNFHRSKFSLTIRTVIFFFFYHVVSGDEGIVNSDELNIVSLKNNPGNQTTNPSEPYILKQNYRKMIQKNAVTNRKTLKFE